MEIKGKIEIADDEIVLAKGGSNQVTLKINSSHTTGSYTLSLPNLAAGDALVGEATAATLTNKTLTSPKINEDVAVTATATELNVLDGVTAATAEINVLDGIEASTAELNYVKGVTSAIQDQIDDKASLSALSSHESDTSTHGVSGDIVGTTDAQTLTNKTLTSPKINEDVALTATATELNILDGIDVSTEELNYVKGTTSAIQSQIDSKADDSAFSAHESATTTHGVSGDIVGTSDAQTLTNKTIDGASNTLTVVAGSQLSGQVPIANGGTGQSTANDALNALLPSQTGNANKALVTDGTDTFWASVATNSLDKNNVKVGDAMNTAVSVDTSSVGDILASSTGGLIIKGNGDLVILISSGDFSAGALLFSRIGDHVVVTGYSKITHSSTSTASSAPGLVPIEFCPTTPVQILCNASSPNAGALVSFRIDTIGTLSFTYVGYDGNPVNETSPWTGSFSPAIAYLGY